MSTVYGESRYGEAHYGDATYPQILPPRSEIVANDELPVDLGHTPEPPAVTIPRDWRVNPHRENES